VDASQRKHFSKPQQRDAMLNMQPSSELQQLSEQPISQLHKLGSKKSLMAWSKVSLDL